MEGKGRFSRFIDLLSRVFGPIIPVLTAAGILKGLLMFALVAGVLTDTSGVYRILYAVADGFFYFLPVFIAFSGAKEFGANPYTGALISLALLYPELVGDMADGTRLSFLGLPVVPVNYPSSILPVFLAMACLGKVEPWFERRIPVLLKSFGVPLCSGVVVYLATILAFGPVGAMIGNGLASAYQWAYAMSPTIAGSILSGIFQPVVLCGFHWSVFPICVENIAKYGEDTLMAIISTGVYAQAGAVFAVMIKTKDRNQRSVCLSAGITALFGTTEPAVFGATLPLKTPYLMACISAFVGGGIIGFCKATAKAFAFPSLATLPVFMGTGFGLYLLACGLTLVMSFVLTMVFCKKGLSETKFSERE